MRARAAMSLRPSHGRRTLPAVDCRDGIKLEPEEFRALYAFAADRERRLIADSPA